MIDKPIAIDFKKVFEVLNSVKYDHDVQISFDACFKNWNQSFDTEEKLIAGLIRIALFDTVTGVVKRLSSNEIDMRDVFIILMSIALGLDKLSLLVELAEKGLKKVYRDEDFEVLDLCLSKMFETLSQKIISIVGEYPTKGVILQ